MTELEKIERAKMYIDKLAALVNKNWTQKHK